MTSEAMELEDAWEKIDEANEVVRQARDLEYGSIAQDDLFNQARPIFDEAFQLMDDLRPSFEDRDNEPLDLRGIEGVGDAALLLFRDLFMVSEDGNQKPMWEVVIRGPEVDREEKPEGSWQVVWESGPFDWGIRVSMGGPLHQGIKRPFAKGIHSEHWMAEPYYSFDVVFTPK